MSSSMGGANGSGEGDSNNSMMGNHPSYQRLSLTQKAALERFMVDYPHSTERQRNQLAAEIGLEPKQIKFWVQNKRMQIKNQNERADNKALRIENSRIQNENQLIRETMMNTICLSCRGLACPEEGHAHLQRMRLENERLRIHNARLSEHLQRYFEKQITQQEYQALLEATMASFSLSPLEGNSPNPGGVAEFHNQHSNFGPQIMQQEMLLPNQMMSGNNSDMESRMMVEIGNAAMDELVKLIHINEPIWIKSSRDGKYILNLEDYEKTFLRAKHFNAPNVHVESSKSSTVVNMSPMKLIDMFLDSEKWANLFPTIITKAEKLHVVQPGLLYNRSGALQLMYGKIHTLSHLVPSREFCFLRYCQQVGVDEWVICDVSHDIFGDNNNNSISGCWKHPSGCMIQDMHNGSSMVTWIEHVEVSERTQTHPLYKDVVNSKFVYGSERWIVELRRMCERFSLYNIERVPTQELGRVVNSIKGRRCVMNISQRMMKIFCENLTIPYSLDMQNISGGENGQAKISIRKCIEPGQPHGMVVVAITSLWLPLPYKQVFEFLIDDTKKHQWDVLSGGTPVQRIVKISNGSNPGNSTSITQVFSATESNMLVLQESFTDPTGSYVVYAPLDVAALDIALNDEESTMVEILPSGFVICGDGKPNATTLGRMNNNRDGEGTSRGGAEGSLLTVALQILVCSVADMSKVDMRTVSKVNTVLNTVVTNLRNALDMNNAE